MTASFGSNRKFGVWAATALLVWATAGLSGCGTVTSIKLFSVSLKVVDDKEQPFPNAVVQTTDGQKTSTDANGMATIKFGIAGVHVLSVVADNRAPATVNVTMPVDMGKTLTVRLVPTVNYSAAVNVNMGAMLYPMLFQAMFSAHGYSMEFANFNPGEWTEWQIGSGRGDPMVMRKSFLTTTSDGQQWWQMYLMDRKGKGNDMTIEVMFSKDRQSLRRMRQQTGKQAPGEVPVTEGWYTPPTRLTPESVQGAIVKRGVAVTVPAGKFTADELVFSAMGAGKLHMWRAAGVPGGVVKAELVGTDGKVAWTSELTKKGTGAKTALGSY